MKEDLQQKTLNMLEQACFCFVTDLNSIHLNKQIIQKNYAILFNFFTKITFFLNALYFA